MATKKTPLVKKRKTNKEAKPKKEKFVEEHLEISRTPRVGPCLRAFESLVSKLSAKDKKTLSGDLELLHNAVAKCPNDCGCSDQEKTSVIFSADSSFLGELMTRSGGLTGLIMSRDGDELLGPHVEAWQVMGLCQDETMTSVKLRDERFLEAFGMWCGNNGCKLVTLMPSQIELWNVVQSSRLSDEERYLTIEKLAHEPLDAALVALTKIGAV